MVQIADAISFVDAEGSEHNALVTAVFEGDGEPSINVVCVSDDPNAHDQYGRQLAERTTSVVHQSRQAAHGMYWK